MEARQGPGVEADEGASGRKCLAGLRILLADDDAAVRGFLHRVLVRAGARVSEACDGREALDQVRRGARFHVALLDVEMPHLRGTDVARTLRGSPKDGPVGRLIGMSGSGPPDDAEPSLFDGFLSKPFSREGLVSAVRACGRQPRAG